MGALRGRLGAAPDARRVRCQGCRPSSRACGSRTCPTSTSAFRRAASAAVERAVEWVEERQPDLTLITGDLLSRPTAEGRLRELVARLPRCFAVLGNHDYAHTRDPFSQPRRSRRPRAGDAARGRLADDRAARPARADRRRRPAHVPRGGSRDRSGSPIRTPTCASCSATTRASSTASRKASSTSCWRATCTTARSASRGRAAGCGSRTSAWTYIQGLYRRPAATLHLSRRPRHDVRAVPLPRPA